MSCTYADGLSPYDNKGKLGLEEKFDSQEEVTKKVVLLADLIQKAKHVVVHSGAGISTSAGIPDFRGPKGVWTLEAKGLKPQINISFDEAIPTKTHMALAKLVEVGKVHYIVSQNIDGLHLRSGLPRQYLSELHGNMFIEQCNQCERQFVRNTATTTVGQRCLNKFCLSMRRNGRPCRGRLHDTILDWEHNLPEKELGLADFHSCIADLCLCLGTTMQIVPSGNLPLSTKKHGGQLVICNLQPTKHDRKADLIIHSYVDEVMVQLMKLLDIPIPEYKLENDPTKCNSKESKIHIEWTINETDVKKMRKIYEATCCKAGKKRKIKSGQDNKSANDSDEEKKIKEEKEFSIIKQDDVSQSKISTPQTIVKHEDSDDQLLTQENVKVKMNCVGIPKESNGVSVDAVVLNDDKRIIVTATS